MQRLDGRDRVRLDGLGARRPPPRLRSTRRSAVESGSTDSGGATSSTIFTSSSESRRRSKRFLASMRAASRGKEGSGAIYFGLLPGVHACSERRQGRKWRRASERSSRGKEGRKRRSPTMAAVERVGPLPDPCVRASKQGKWRGPRRDLLP